jgi:hypothetical protein
VKLAVTAAVAAAALLASGCATYENVEPPPDPFGDAGKPVRPDLTLGVIPGETVYHLEGMLGSSGPMEQKMRGDSLAVVVTALRQHFKTVERVANPWEAAQKGYDLMATAGVEYVTEGVRNKYDRFKVTLAFADPKRGPVDTVTAEGKSMDFQDFGHGLNGGDTFVKSGERAAKFLAIALRGSQALAAYAPGAGPAAPTAAAPAPRQAAPAAPSFRSDVESPSYRLPEDERKFALVVGVESYQDLPPAEHAARDAKAVKAHLLAAGYPERNIIFLADAKAGRTALDKYLDAWLPKNTDERSTVFFYFSGHGAPDPAKGDAYLMPWDGDAKFVESTGYPVKRLYEKLGALRAKRVLVAMDSCFSGAGGRSVIAKGLRPLVAKVDASAGSGSRVAALTASAGDEVTGTDDGSGHGLFTYHLLKGLEAKGGKATLQELYDYLSPKVRDAARRDNRDQTPQLSGAGSTPL